MIPNFMGLGEKMQKVPAAVICMTHLLTPGNGASFVQREADSYVP